MFMHTGVYICMHVYMCLYMYVGGYTHIYFTGMIIYTKIIKENFHTFLAIIICFI